MNKMYSTSEAADYIGITVSGMWYHIQRGNLKPTKVGNSNVFTKSQLDEFLRNKRGPGRPPKEEER
jgi:excisionase family DNA binding protein